MFKSRVGISIAILASLFAFSGAASAEEGYRSVVYTTPMPTSDAGYYGYGHNCKTIPGRDTSHGYVPRHRVCRVAYYSPRGRYHHCYTVKGRHHNGVYVAKHRVCYTNRKIAVYEGHYVCTKYELSVTPQHTDKQCTSWDWRPESFSRAYYYR